MSITSNSCGDDHRLAVLEASGTGGVPALNGIEYVDVGADQQTLTVHLVHEVPKGLTEANVRIDGGRRITGIRVLPFQIAEHHRGARASSQFTIKTDRAGDFSPYVLRLVDADSSGRPGTTPLAGFDRFYGAVEFDFKVDCPTGLDFAQAPSCPPAARQEPEIDYLTKDYAGFLQLMYDRMALTIPGWTERHAPDEGVALVEVLAYTGDYLSYLQDAVATEAYLGTARQRISVRRHARLVDYVMHDGCNARTWVCLSVAPAVPSAKIDFDPSPSPSPLKPPVQFLTGIQAAGSSLPVVFEVVSPRSLTVYQAHNEIYFYTWGNRECCLSRGATTATLWSGKDAYQKDATVPLSLNPGDVLIFEEVTGPKTGVMADADSSHRQAVRLTSVTEVTDPLLGHLVYDVEWAQEDQLAFTLCISTIGAAPGCAERRNVSVARGNVVLVDQGETVFDQMTVPPAPIAVAECVAVGQERDVPQPAPEFSPPPLAQYPVTQSVPFPVPGPIAHREARVLAGLLFRVRGLAGDGGGREAERPAAWRPRPESPRHDLRQGRAGGAGIDR